LVVSAQRATYWHGLNKLGTRPNNRYNFHAKIFPLKLLDLL
jgi:hypothetical protein